MPRKAGCCRAARSPRESGKGGKFQSWRDIGYKHTQPQKDAENGRIKGLSQRRRDRSNPTRDGAEGIINFYCNKRVRIFVSALKESRTNQPGSPLKNRIMTMDFNDLSMDEKLNHLKKVYAIMLQYNRGYGYMRWDGKNLMFFDSEVQDSAHVFVEDLEATCGLMSSMVKNGK
jgi:hypothetical protein